MSDNDYASRQAERDREYAGCYDTPEALAWVATLSPAERQSLEVQGLLKPMMDRCGSTMRDEDASESNTASETPDVAEAIDRESADGEAAQLEPLAPVEGPTAWAAGDALASFCARVRGRANPALVFDAICYATGVTDVEGVSATDLAARHGITKQAFSKIAVDWCQTFNLQPSRSMKSKIARKVYRERAKQVHKRRKLTTDQQT